LTSSAPRSAGHEPPPTTQQWGRITNAEWGVYERLYGDPITMSLDTLLDEAVRPRQAIRTFGHFAIQLRPKEQPEEASGTTGKPPRPEGREAASPISDRPRGNPISFQICGERQHRCMTIFPVEEIASSLEADAQSYFGQRVYVTGAFDGPGFLFWSFEGGPDPASRSKDGRDSGLRALLAAAGAAPKVTVRVRGQFRGRNLFGDLPEETRRGSSDWVIADQGVAAWVTGRAPKGSGWSLDLDSKSESSRWLEIEGEPVARDGVVYLKAKVVSLVNGPLAPPDKP
jgi:hypothetical protein